MKTLAFERVLNQLLHSILNRILQLGFTDGWFRIELVCDLFRLFFWGGGGRRFGSEVSLHVAFGLALSFLRLCHGFV